jgi:hypothetical protein
MVPLAVARRACALAFAHVLAAGGCAGSSPAPSRAEHTPVDLPQPPLPSATPARWIDASGATAVGPAAAGGTLVLLGGRRAIVGATGSVRPEATPSPEPLLELIEVPVSGGARRLVGRGVYGVYRFDDPLGAPATLARSEVEILRIGSGPGVVAVWDIASDLPRFLDVDTGQMRSLAGLPAPPLRAIAFRDPQQGAGIFEAAGLAVTNDGGASWRLAVKAGAGADRALAPGDVLRVTGLRLRDDALRAYAEGDRRDALVDPAAARLGPFDAEPAPAGEAPLLRWIRTTGRDPLDAAIASGVAAGPGVALAASRGLLAHVEMTSGTLLDLTAFAQGSGISACGIGGTGRAAWVACALSEDASGDLYNPFGVFRVPLAAGRPAPEPPALMRSGEAELRTSPSGGAMLLAPCSADEEGIACVRQPSGRWITIRSDSDILEHGAGPLADGRIAIVRGLWDGDVATEGDREGGSPTHAEATAGQGDARGEPDTARRTHVAVIDATGKERPFNVGRDAADPSTALGWPGSAGADLRVVSPLEEGTDHALSFVVANDEGELSAIVQPPGAAPSLQRLAGATHAKIHAGYGVAVGDTVVLASLDAGLSWAPLSLPPRVTTAIAHLGGLLGFGRRAHAAARRAAPSAPRSAAACRSGTFALLRDRTRCATSASRRGTAAAARLA